MGAHPLARAPLLASRQTLDDVWASVRDLPLVVEAVIWLIAFAFLIGLLACG